MCALSSSSSMEEISQYNDILSSDWNTSLQKIKEYILSLISKKKKKQKKEQIQVTKKDIEDALESETEKELTEKEKKKEKEQEEEKQQWWKNPPQEKWDFDIPPQDKDEYIPRDSEFGEALWEPSRFAEIYPPFLGYYAQGKKSYFDKNTNLRSKKKQLSDISHQVPEWSKLYTYAWVINEWITSIPLPDTALPDTWSLCFHSIHEPKFQKDQHNCMYLMSKEKQYISFHFALWQTKTIAPPIPHDTEKIIFDRLSKETQTLMKGLQWSTTSPLMLAQAIKRHIITTKKYSTKVQGTLRNKSNSSNYITHLDESPILECFSANSLFVALCRELGIAARLCVGHMVQSASKGLDPSKKEQKALLSKDNGHARSEIYDTDKKQRVRVDATPTIKEDGEKSNENGQEQEDKDKEENQESENNFDENQEWGEWDDEWKESDEGQEKESDKESESKKDKDSSKENKKKTKQKNTSSEKSPEEMLDELIEKAKEDTMTEQAEKIQETLDKLEQAKDKEEMKKILDESALEDFAKDMVDKIGNEWILEEEKKELENLTDEKDIEKKLKDSLLNDEYKEKLKNYSDILKEKIEEQKKRMKSEMENYGFKEQEIHLYQLYKQLEKEVEPQVKKQIAELQKLLPPSYQILKDEENFYRSGYNMERNKLVHWKVTGDNKIFKRNKTELENNEINMFETIMIDKSGSMWSFGDKNSPIRNAIKAAITRAKVLEHFKVQMSIVIFGDKIEEVMSFGEQFSNRSTKIPSTLMRVVTTGSWWNSQEPMTYTYSTMKRKMKELGGKSFGNISFIGDGDLYQFQEIPQLKLLIQDLKKSGMGVTAYYINNSQQKMPLINYYFGSPEDGGAVYAKDVEDLSSKIVNAHRTHLSRIISKFIK